jgi:hypothetical protein
MEDIAENEGEPRSGTIRKNSLKSSTKKKKRGSPRNLPDLSKHNSSDKFGDHT